MIQQMKKSLKFFKEKCISRINNFEYDTTWEKSNVYMNTTIRKPNQTS